MNELTAAKLLRQTEYHWHFGGGCHYVIRTPRGRILYESELFTGPNTGKWPAKARAKKHAKKIRKELLKMFVSANAFCDLVRKKYEKKANQV